MMELSPSPELLAMIERRTGRVRRRRIIPDPILGAASGIVSRLSSLPKIDGDVIHAAVVEAVNRRPDLVVHSEWRVPISDAANRLASAGRYAQCLGTDLPYDDAVAGRVKIDLVTIDREAGTAAAYEIKRGHGTHDSGKRQKIVDDLIRVGLVLAGHLRAKGYPEVRTATVHLISYYGSVVAGPIPRLDRTTVDAHFGVPVTAVVGATAELMAAAARQMFADELGRLFALDDTEPEGRPALADAIAWSAVCRRASGVDAATAGG